MTAHRHDNLSTKARLARERDRATKRHMAAKKAARKKRDKKRQTPTLFREWV